MQIRKSRHKREATSTFLSKYILEEFPPVDMVIPTLDEIDEKRRKSSERRLCFMKPYAKFLKIFLAVDAGKPNAVKVWDEMLNSKIFKCCLSGPFIKHFNRCMARPGAAERHNKGWHCAKTVSETHGQIHYAFMFHDCFLFCTQWPTMDTNYRNVKVCYYGKKKECRAVINDWFDRGYRKDFLPEREGYTLEDTKGDKFYFSRTREDLQKKSAEKRERIKKELKQVSPDLSEFIVSGEFVEVKVEEVKEPDPNVFVICEE